MRIAKRRKTRAFTLVELLVVIAIIGILVALLLPAVQAAREAARRMSCTNNMKQLGLAVLNYESTHREFPLAYTPNWTGNGDPSNGLKEHNFLTFLLPFMEYENIYDQIDFGQHGVINNRVAQTAFNNVIPEFLCASAPERGLLESGPAINDVPRLYGAADYATCVAIINSAYFDLRGDGLLTDRGCPSAGTYCPALDNILQDKRSTVSMVTDGLSKTMMVFEDAGRPWVFTNGVQEFVNGAAREVSSGRSWGDPDQYFVWGNSQDCGLTSVMNCSNWDEVYSFHSGGANITFGDGSVHFLQESIDIETFVSLLTRGAGDIIKGDY